MNEEDVIKKLTGISSIERAVEIANAIYKESMGKPGTTKEQAHETVDTELKKYGWSLDMLHSRRYT